MDTAKRLHQLTLAGVQRPKKYKQVTGDYSVAHTKQPELLRQVIIDGVPELQRNKELHDTRAALGHLYGALTPYKHHLCPLLCRYTWPIEDRTLLALGFVDISGSQGGWWSSVLSVRNLSRCS